MEYNKLVRDRIPEIIKKRGKVLFTHIAGDEEYWLKLKEKLMEEVNEFIEDSNEEELADVLEVVEAICKFKGYGESIEKIRIRKRKERGGFRERIILECVE